MTAPFSPLDHFKKSAKALLRNVVAQNPHACNEVRGVFLDLADKPDAEIAACFGLMRAQHVVALRHGFPKWNDLNQRSPDELRAAITRARSTDIRAIPPPTPEPAMMNDPVAYDLLTDEQKRVLGDWILAHFKPANTVYAATSYGMKQPFTGAGQGPFYITNGQFKGAMRAAGFDPVDATEMNWRFRVARKINDPKPGSFLEWLLKRKARNSPLGELARDASEDRDFPPGELTQDELLGYLRRRQACSEAVDAANRAWRAFTGRVHSSPGRVARGKRPFTREQHVEHHHEDGGPRRLF